MSNGQAIAPVDTADNAAFIDTNSQNWAWETMDGPTATPEADVEYPAPPTASAYQPIRHASPDHPYWLGSPLKPLIE